MSDQNADYNPNDGVPGGDSIPRGLNTLAEQISEEKRKKSEAKKAASDSFKNRQVNAVEAANSLASRNLVLTCIVGVISAAACVGTWYQSSLSKKSWDTAQKTLAQMKTDSEESSKQFQVQLGHFDEGLGRTGLLAIHAGSRLTRLPNLRTPLEKSSRGRRGLSSSSGPSRLTRGLQPMAGSRIRGLQP